MRIFGQTAVIQGGTIDSTVKNVFLRKPCFGVWQDLGNVVSGALESMHLIDHVTKRYYSPYCHIFTRIKYGEDRLNMTPGLCKACDALAPRTSPFYQNSYRPIKESPRSPIKEDGDDDWQNHITKEENIESDLQTEVPMKEEEFGIDANNAWINDVNTEEEKPHNSPDPEEGAKTSDTAGDLVKIHT